MNTVNSRASNIELLRIVSMIIIVFYHIITNSVVPNFSNEMYLTKPLISILHLGVICFVLISGYWGIKFSLKSFFRLVLYCSFYSVLTYIISIVIRPDSFSIVEAFKAVIPYQWWYIPVYLCLFLLTPLINIPLESGSKQIKLFLILVLGIISIGFGQFVPSLVTGKNPINFVLIYYLGNFIKTEVHLKHILTSSQLFLIYLLLTAFVFLSIWLTDMYVPHMSDALFKIFFPYNSIGLLIISILFFTVFIRLTISSKLINWIASSTLAVYLLHENRFLGHYMYDAIGKLIKTVNHVGLSYLIMIGLALTIFMVFVSIDKLIAPVFNRLIDLIFNSSLYKKLDNKVPKNFITGSYK